MADRPDPRSGLDEDGVWTPAFEGQRPPLEPGHELTVRHGAYSQLRLTQRAGEIVDEFRELVSRYRASEEPMVRLLAVTWARVEAAAEALEKADGPEQPSRLERDLRAWVRVARQLLTDRGSRRQRVRGWASTFAQPVRALNIIDLAAAAIELDDLAAAEQIGESGS